MTQGSIADVHCPNCGAPARYDIIKHCYHCAYCGGQVQISEALAEKQGFRALQQQKMKAGAGQYHLMKANCSGCGALLVFGENEAMANCAFCGRSLTRSSWLNDEDLPEMILPFRITREEAASCLTEWCSKNSGKRESKDIVDHLDGLQGFYLPYELIRGPVNSRVSRKDSYRSYRCRGYVDNEFINCSSQLDNLLLDAMEPYELDELAPFDFAYAAGQRIKIRDVSEQTLCGRINTEVSNDYRPMVEKTLETKAVDISTDPAAVMRMPVLLPAYYLRAGETIAAVNGQTGKVSVRAAKESHFYFIPWWCKAILSTLAVGLISLGAFLAFGMERTEALLIAGMLMLVTIIITLCLFSDTVHNSFRVESGRKIFRSSGGPLRREGNTLVRDDETLKKKFSPPVFLESLEGRETPVVLRFTSLSRILQTAALALFVLFLPVLLALLINGFDFERLTLGGSAVWFCIMVPVVPIYVLKFAIAELYDRPWIYILQENGRKKRYREKLGFRITWEGVKAVLKAFVIPPVSLAVWFGIACFCVMVYLTAFGFD